MKSRSIALFRLLVGLLLLTLALSMASAARAQDPSVRISMEAQPALGGYFKYGEWLPVWVTLENDGEDIVAEVQVRLAEGSGGTTYAAPADLPTGSRKRIPIYLLPNSFSHELQVQLVAGDSILASRKVMVNPQPNINYLVGLLAPQRGALSLINTIALPGQARPVILVDLALADLPERPEGLRSLDTIVLNATDTSSLTPKQRTALETWVRQGGRLVIGGGAAAQSTAAGLPERLLPMIPHGLTDLEDLPALGAYAGGEAVRVPGPFVVSTGDPQENSRTLIRQGELPILQELAVDKGWVDFVALDLSGAPFNAWTGTSAFWEGLLSPGASYPEWLPFDMSLRQTRAGSMPYALTNLPALDLPSIRWLGILLSLYVILVGPVNYLVLRWRKQLHLAWITTPLFTLVFSAGAFGLGYALHGTDLILNKIAIIEPGRDGTAAVSSYLGLFSPAQQSYRIEVEGASLLSPLRLEGDPWGTGMTSGPAEMSFLQGDPAQVRGLTVNQWSMQSFMAESTWPGFGQVTAGLQLQGDSQAFTLAGTLLNETAYSLSDAVLVLGSQFVRLGDLAPGEVKQVRMDVSTLLGQPFEPSISYKIFQEELERPNPNGPPREIQLKQTVIDSVFPWGSWYGPVFGANASLVDPASRNHLLLMAWLDQAPPEVRIAGRTPVQQTTALLVQPLAYSLPEGDRLSLPPGFLAGNVIEINDGGFCGPMGMPAVYLGREQVVFEFVIPKDLEAGDASQAIQVDALVLHIGTDIQGQRPPQTMLYDWTNESWIAMEEAQNGRNVLQQVENLIGQDGKVRVRLEPNNFSGGCFFLAMGLEGSRH